MIKVRVARNTTITTHLGRFDIFEWRLPYTTEKLAKSINESRVDLVYTYIVYII